MNYQDDPLSIDSVLPRLKANNNVQVLQQIAREAGKVCNINQAYLASRLLHQEKMASSGIGNGIALPHLTFSQITKPYLLFARLQDQVDFDAVDGQPVDIACLLLSPTSDGPLHLRRLSRITRKFREEEFINSLRSTRDADLLRVLWQDKDYRQLAAA